MSNNGSTEKYAKQHWVNYTMLKKLTILIMD